MALNIPMPQLPLSGLNQAISTGGNLFSQMMNPVIQRENMMREWQQHLNNLNIQQQQENRLGALLPFQKRAAQFQLDALERQNDPQKALEYMKEWQNSLKQFMPQNGQSSNGSQGPAAMGNEPTISVGNQQIPLSVAQMFAALKAPIPGINESLKNYYETQKELGKATAKETVKRQSELGDQFSDTQSGLAQIGRIQQIMQNYAKEAKDLGYGPRYGVGAEFRTEPNAFKRTLGRIEQRIAHPLESFTHPADIGELFGVGKGSEVHEKYLSELRGELNNLVNTQAKNLNSRFTQKEYEVLLANKPSISDSEVVLKGKLKAISDAMQNAALKLKMQQAYLQSGSRPGMEPFASESNLPSEESGRLATGQYNTPKPTAFESNGYEYVLKDGKYYRRKR